MKLVALVAVAALAATPALAAKAKKKHHHYRHDGAYLRVVPDDGYAYRRGPGRADPYAVYSYDGRYIGRDPDINVRRQMQVDDGALRRW